MSHVSSIQSAVLLVIAATKCGRRPPSVKARQRQKQVCVRSDGCGASFQMALLFQKLCRLLIRYVGLLAAARIAAAHVIVTVFCQRTLPPLQLQHLPLFPF